MESLFRIFKCVVLIVQVIFSVAICSAIDKPQNCAGQPLYSSHGVESGPVTSPDGQKIVTMERKEGKPDDYTIYHVQVGSKQLKARLTGFRTEILWSPDSKSFAVNQTEGGGGIGQRAYVFYIKSNHLHKIDVSTPVEKEFGRPVKCEVGVDPNTAVLEWLDPKRILVVAEIVNVSICKCPGTFMTYELSFPDLRILQIYSQAETRRRFSRSLGCELRPADDSCARTWQKLLLL